MIKTSNTSPVIRIAHGYVAAIENLLIVGMLAVVILAALQVFFRYVLGMSLSWSEEALRYVMIWTASLGIGLAYSRGDMIGMEMLVNLLPRRVAIAVGLLSRLLILAMMFAIVWYGWQFAWKTRGGSATAIPISMFWFHISIAVGAALVAMHVIVSAIASLKGVEEQKSNLQEVV